MSKYLLRTVGLGYLAVLLVAPVCLVFFRTFEHGLSTPWHEITSPAAVHAFWITMLIAAFVIPANTIFGVLCALALVRYRFPGKSIVNVLVDLPLALSPIVVGLAFLILYGTGGWLHFLDDAGFQVVFALPGMILATIFISLPFVVREVVPVLREIGTDQEQAASVLGASPLQTFWRVTLPAIRWAVAYGVVLTMARTLGEFGAVSIISGRIVEKTETMTIHVEERFLNFDLVGAYTASVVLAVVAVATLLAMNLLRPKEGTR
jgi:sulfate transport system permease protein